MDSQRIGLLVGGYFSPAFLLDLRYLSFVSGRFFLVDGVVLEQILDFLLAVRDGLAILVHLALHLFYLPVLAGHFLLQRLYFYFVRQSAIDLLSFLLFNCLLQ